MPNGISASQIAGHYIIHIFKKKKNSTQFSQETFHE